MDRRTFIKTSLTSAGGIMVTFTAQTSGMEKLAKNNKIPLSPIGFIEISPDNTIKFQLTKLEMGQGVGTSYLAILAEELDVFPEDIHLVATQYNHKTHDLYHKINWGITGGSSSVRAGWLPLREAAAMTKQLLLQAAANFWKVPIQQCAAVNGQVTNQANNHFFSYGDLTALAATLPAPTNVQLKKKEQFRFIGKSQKSYLHQDIVTGKQKYGIDFVIAGMKYATIKHCPTISGKVKNFNEKEVRALSGVSDVLVLSRDYFIRNAKNGDPLDDASVREGVAVIANSTWAAFNAVSKLKVEWQHDIEKQSNKSLEATCLEMLKTVSKPLMTHGNPFEQLESANTVVSEIYQCPYVSHHYMEPLNAVASISEGKCEIWAGTQSPVRDVFAISNALNIKPEHVKVNVQATGGAFGRKYNPDFTLEAAYLSKQIKQPVRLLWTREEEVSCGQQGDYELQKFSVGLDENKQITSYQWQSVISGKWVSELNLYLVHVPNFHLSRKKRDKTLNLAPWRAVQKARTNLGVECFIDELAHHVKQDPLKYRLTLLEEPVRLAKLPKEHQWVIDFSTSYRTKYQLLLKELQKGDILSKNLEVGRGQGIALGYYSGSTIIQVVDLTIIDNICKINEITSIVNCGIVVDLSGAEQQIEGSIIWTLNALFMPATQFKDSQITQSNFNDAPLLKMNQIPPLNTHFIDSNEQPTGLGEPAVCSLAPAVLNAIFAATGKRIRNRQITQYELRY
jgi:isoquinoline 1-oxidoreductase beta subunit